MVDTIVASESEKMIAELKAYCLAERGRSTQVARELEVSPQTLSRWFSGERTPTWDAGLKIQAFLKKQRRKNL